MITNNILQFIPQRHPFVMVDTLLFADEKTTSTSFTITSDNILCSDGFFNEAGLMENIAQTIAAGKGYIEQQENKKISGGYIAGVKNFEVFALPKIYDVLTTETTVTETIFNMTVIIGKVLLNDVVIARCEMKVFTNTND